MLRVKNDRILLRHPIDGINACSEAKCLILRGHSHMTKFAESSGTYCFYLPTFSDMETHQKGLFPCAFLMNLRMNHGYFVQGIFNQLYVDSKVYVLNELNYNLSLGKSISTDSVVLNEEERETFLEETENKKEESEKVLVKRRLSQIEKFNKRYNK